MIAQMSFFFKMYFFFSEPLGFQQNTSGPTVRYSHANISQMNEDLNFADVALKGTELDISSPSLETSDSSIL